jgi:hypothetical protein
MLGVSTGLESFLNPDEIGVLYPFPGGEFLFFVVAFVLWLLWHVLQIRSETRENRDAREFYAEIGLDRAMYHGGSALIATEEEWQERPATGAHHEGGHGATAGGTPA